MEIAQFAPPALIISGVVYAIYRVASKKPSMENLAMLGLPLGLLEFGIALGGLISRGTNSHGNGTLVETANIMSAFTMLPAIVTALCDPAVGGWWLIVSGAISALLWPATNGFAASQQILFIEIFLVLPMICMGAYALAVRKSLRDLEPLAQSNLEIRWLGRAGLIIGFLNLYWGLFAEGTISSAAYFSVLPVAILVYRFPLIAAFGFALGSILSLVSLVFVRMSDHHMVFGAVIFQTIPTGVIAFRLLKLTSHRETRLI